MLLYYCHPERANETSRAARSCRNDESMHDIAKPSGWPWPARDTLQQEDRTWFVFASPSWS